MATCSHVKYAKRTKKKKKNFFTRRKINKPKKYDLVKHEAILADEFFFVNANSMRLQEL